MDSYLIFPLSRRCEKTRHGHKYFWYHCLHVPNDFQSWNPFFFSFGHEVHQNILEVSPRLELSLYVRMRKMLSQGFFWNIFKINFYVHNFFLLFSPLMALAFPSPNHAPQWSLGNRIRFIILFLKHISFRQGNEGGEGKYQKENIHLTATFWFFFSRKHRSHCFILICEIKNQDTE